MEHPYSYDKDGQGKAIGMSVGELKRLLAGGGGRAPGSAAEGL